VDEDEEEEEVEEEEEEEKEEYSEERAKAMGTETLPTKTSKRGWQVVF
jgi:hypothetical protein